MLHPSWPSWWPFAGLAPLHQSLLITGVQNWTQSSSRCLPSATSWGIIPSFDLLAMPQLTQPSMQLAHITQGCTADSWYSSTQRPSYKEPPTIIQHETGLSESSVCIGNHPPSACCGAEIDIKALAITKINTRYWSVTQVLKSRSVEKEISIIKPFQMIITKANWGAMKHPVLWCLKGNKKPLTHAKPNKFYGGIFCLFSPNRTTSLKILL